MRRAHPIALPLMLCTTGRFLPQIVFTFASYTRLVEVRPTNLPVAPLLFEACCVESTR